MSTSPSNDQKTKRPNKLFRFVTATLQLSTWSNVFRTAIGNPKLYLDTTVNLCKKLIASDSNDRFLPETAETDIQGRKKMKQCMIVFFGLCAFTLFNFLTAVSVFPKVVNGALFAVFLTNMVFCYMTLRNITPPKDVQ